MDLIFFSKFQGGLALFDEISPPGLILAKILFGLYERGASPPRRDIAIPHPRSRLGGLEISHVNVIKIACVQTLLISFQRGSPPVESAHRRPNPCSEPRAIPSLEEPSH